MRIKSYIYSLMATIFMVSCSGYEPEVNVNPRDITPEYVLDANEYSILNRALEITNTDLSAGGATLFAPSNTAFNVLFDRLGVSTIEEVDAATLSQILQYHVIPSALFSESLTEEGNSTLVTDRELYVVIPEGGGLNVNGKANIIDADRVTANNLVIHGIDRVLDIPVGNLFEVISADTTLTILRDALIRTGLDGAISGSNEFTILAPENDAFDGVDVAAMSDSLLTAVLSFHVIPSRLFSQQVPEDSRVASILGDESSDIEQINVGTLTFNGVDLSDPNVTATNGVVHKVQSIVEPIGVISELLDPNSDTPRSGNDGVGLDQMGTVSEGLSYERLMDISLTSSVYTVLFGQSYADFATDEEALEYLTGQIFDGTVNVDNLNNGDKVTAVSGAEYYLGFDDDGFAYVNGRSSNAFSTPGTFTTNYDGSVFIFDQAFVPIPETDMAATLGANPDYDLISLAITTASRNTSLSSGDNTFFTVNDDVFKSTLGYDSTALQAVIADPTSETSIAIIEELQELFDRHTVQSVNFSVYIASEIPTLTNVLGEEIFFAEVDGDIVIVEDLKDVTGTTVALENVDILYSNGTIHEIDRPLDL